MKSPARVVPRPAPGSRPGTLPPPAGPARPGAKVETRAAAAVVAASGWFCTLRNGLSDPSNPQPATAARRGEAGLHSRLRAAPTADRLFLSLRWLWLWLAMGGLFAAGFVGAEEPPGSPSPPLYALVVGGGPDVASNAAQIEGHVRFVAGLLPAAARRTVLFADGRNDADTVTQADARPAAEARRALAVLLADHDAEEPVTVRAPRLGVPVDGPARLADFRRALGRFSNRLTRQPAPLLLYFAGHGTQDEKNETGTHYDLWEGEALTVHVLADEIARLPRGGPVVLVMAQCFSGAFADVLFRGGEPGGTPAGENIVGFFSAEKDREAAGCSYATGRGDYQDFSSYFFGALCGRDRFGDAVAGADYDGDGAVSLHEAFCYALIHDPSADTPVCTSDVFLRTRAGLPSAKIYGVPYREVLEEATPGQRAVLEALSERLELSGEARAVAVFDRLTYGDPAARPELLQAQAQAKARLGDLRQRELGRLFERWPALRWGDVEADGYKKASAGAVDELGADEARRSALLEAGNAVERADEAVENEAAALQRFASVYEHLAEARRLRGQGGGEIKAQYEKLWQAEQRVLPLAAPDKGPAAPANLRPR